MVFRVISGTITSVFIGVTSVAAEVSDQTKSHDSPFTHTPVDKIIYLTTDSVELKNACPLLTTTALITQPFDKIEMPERTPSLYLSGEILEPEDMSPQKAEEIDKFKLSFLQASQDDTFFVHINSYGGATNTSAPLARDMYRTNGSIITYASYYAASAAFDILISGTNGLRAVTADTYLMTHPTAIADEQGNRFEAEDYPVGSENYELLTQMNNNTEAYFVANSDNGLTAPCADMMVEPDTELQILPLDALKLGLVDNVIDWDNRTVTQRIEIPAAP